MCTRPWTIRKRRLAGLMAVVMLLLPLSLPIGAEDAAPALPARIVAEDTAQRGINSKTFTLSDGTYLAVAYPEAVHYQTQSGFAAIDNSFVPAVMVGDAMTGQIRRTDDLAAAQAAPAVSGTAYWANRDNPFSVALPQRLDARAPVVLRHGRHTLRFAAEVAADTAVWSVPEAAEDANAADDIDLTEPAQVRAANDRDMAAPNARAAVSFPGAWTNADLHYAVAGQKLKESILLHDVPQQSDFSFLFAYDTDILRAEVQEDGSVCLTDNEGETAFFIEAPAMFDSGEGYTDAVAVTVEELDGGCRYTLTPDRAWLTDSARVYPVTLDPTVDGEKKTTQNTHYIHDNGVQESDPNKNYITTNRIYIGTSCSGKEGWMYFKLTQWPTVDGLNAATITEAKLHLNYYKQSDYQTAKNLVIDAYLPAAAWDTSTICWNNKPNLSGNAFGGTYIENSVGVSGGTEDVDVTDSVRARYASPDTDKGVCLKPRTASATNGRACFISSDYSASDKLRPIIHIKYTTGSGQAIGVTSGQVYYLRNVNSGRYLDVPNGNNTDGTDLIQYTLKGGRNQQFKLVYNASTKDYSLSPVCAPNSAVEITNTSSDNDAVVQIWAKPSSGVMNSQRFDIVYSSGSYRLLSYASKYASAVVVEGASKNDSAPIIQYTNNGTTNGFWYLEPANKTIKTNASLSANASYRRDLAANYAKTYGATPNSAYQHFGEKGGDCTNFVSQCIYAGTLPMLPEGATFLLEDKNKIENWFYIAGLVLPRRDWYSVSFTSATAFNKHWGQTNMRAFQTIEYASGSEALKDIDFLLRYLKKGDVIQLKNTDDDSLNHSMIVYDDNATCDGKHKGIDGNCPYSGRKEMLYAQHSSDFINGHLRALLKENQNRIVITKLKNDV